MRRHWGRKHAGWSHTEMTQALGMREGAVRTSDETRTSRRGRSAHRASSARGHAPYENSAACTHPTCSGERSVRLWMCRGGLPQLQTDRGDQPGVRGKRSSRSWWLPGAHEGRQPAPTRHADQPTQRARDHTLESPSVAQVQNKARQEQRPVVCIDEAGLYLLPMVTLWMGRPQCSASR